MHSPPVFRSLIQKGLHTAKLWPCQKPSKMRSRPMPTPAAKTYTGESIAPPSVWSKQLLGGLALAGAIQGPLLDGIHGTVHLLEYKAATFDIGGLHSSFWVPLLLGSYYAAVGVLYNLLDTLALNTPSSKERSSQLVLLDNVKGIFNGKENTAATQKVLRQQSWPRLALNVGIVALLLYLSAVLYKNDVQYTQIAAILAVCGIVHWQTFDRTRQGLALALLCAIAAPLSELVIINVFGLWQYPHPDVFGTGGVPSWVACCYFFYTPAVGNLARLLGKSR